MVGGELGEGFDLGLGLTIDDVAGDADHGDVCEGEQQGDDERGAEDRPPPALWAWGGSDGRGSGHGSTSLGGGFWGGQGEGKYALRRVV